MSRTRLGLTVVLAALSTACGSSSPSASGGDAGGDGTMSDAAGTDAFSDAGLPADGGSGGDVTGPGSPALGDPANWTKFDLSTIGLAHGVLLWGIAFDGRYLYYAAYQTGFYAAEAGASQMSGLVVRYDTQAAFTSASSWATYDTGIGGGSAYTGAVFDGRYVTFLPNQWTIASRYDTQGPFGDAGSWTYTTVKGGWAGGTFDGRTVYASPYFGAGLAGAYDTQSSGSGWTTFGVASLDAGVSACAGAAFDGRYVYFSPNGFTVPDGVVPRYDTKGAGFASASSWTEFDTTTVNPKAKGFGGAVFDGRYLYLAPNYDGTESSGLMTRYDTTQPFASAASWSTFDVAPSTMGTGYIGGVYDGRFVYFIPFSSSRLVRYDTSAPFAQASAWSSFDTTTLDPLAYQFHGGAFDGQYVYVASQYGIMLRFQARTMPGPVPGSTHGSFF